MINTVSTAFYLSLIQGRTRGWMHRQLAAAYMKTLQNTRTNPQERFLVFQKFSWTWVLPRSGCALTMGRPGGAIYPCAAKTRTRTQTMRVIPHHKTRDIKEAKSRTVKPQPQHMQSTSGRAAGVSAGNLSDFSCKVELLTARWALPRSLWLSSFYHRRVFPIWHGYAQKITEESLHTEEKSPQWKEMEAQASPSLPFFICNTVGPSLCLETSWTLTSGRRKCSCRTNDFLRLGWNRTRSKKDILSSMDVTICKFWPSFYFHRSQREFCCSPLRQQEQGGLSPKRDVPLPTFSLHTLGNHCILLSWKCRTVYC